MGIGSRRSAIAVAAAMAVTAIGCSAEVSVGDKYMKQADVQQQAAQALATAKNLPVSSVPPIKCPGDLKGKVGTTMVCAMEIGSPPKTYDVNLKVTSVTGDKVNFDVQVAKTPRP